MADRPKVFVFVNGGEGDWLPVVALSEDGVQLAGHVCSSRGFARHDMGVNGPTWSAAAAKLDAYAKHYPDGYELVDLTDLDFTAQGNHEGLMAAIERSKALQAPGSSLAEGL